MLGFPTLDLCGGSVVRTLDWDTESCRIDFHRRQVGSERASSVKTPAKINVRIVLHCGDL